MVHQYHYIWSKKREAVKEIFDFKNEYDLGTNILTLRCKFSNKCMNLVIDLDECYKSFYLLNAECFKK